MIFAAFLYLVTFLVNVIKKNIIDIVAYGARFFLANTLSWITSSSLSVKLRRTFSLLLELSMMTTPFFLPIVYHGYIEIDGNAAI